jgi:hypothetical protein
MVFDYVFLKAFTFLIILKMQNVYIFLLLCEGIHNCDITSALSK